MNCLHIFLPTFLKQTPAQRLHCYVSSVKAPPLFESGDFSFPGSAVEPQTGPIICSIISTFSIGSVKSSFGCVHKWTCAFDIFVVHIRGVGDKSYKA